MIGGNPCQLWPCGPGGATKVPIIAAAQQTWGSLLQAPTLSPRQTPAVPLAAAPPVRFRPFPTVEKTAIECDFARIILCDCPRDRHERGNRSSSVSFPFVQPSRTHVVRITKINETYKTSALISHRESRRPSGKFRRRAHFPAREVFTGSSTFLLTE
jgi:hypothetical protein